MNIAIKSSSCLAYPPEFLEGDQDTTRLLEQNDLGDYVVTNVNYKDHVPASRLRRLSKLSKMGSYCAGECLEESSMENVTSLLVANGRGGFKELASFLERMIRYEEKQVSPIHFLQSLHSDITGQIVLLKGLNGYTNTYTGRGSSFETTLIDAQLLLAEKPEGKILIGGVDALPEIYAEISRNSDFHGGTATKPASNTPVKLGENAVFFGLTAEQKTGVHIIGVQSNLGLTPMNFAKVRAEFLMRHNIKEDDLHIIITGFRDEAHMETYLPDKSGKDKTIFYKKYCGEYPTASSFGMWMGEKLLTGEIKPKRFGFTNENPVNILVMNQYRENNFSFILLTKKI